MTGPTQHPASNSESRKRQAAKDAREALIPRHLTIVEANGTADCDICGTGVTAPTSFGGVPRTDMLATFIVQHAVHTKAGNASGLTANGAPTKAARAALAGGVL